MIKKAPTLISIVLSVSLAAIWVICLRTTDAYYSVYILCALLSLLALLCNQKQSVRLCGSSWIRSIGIVLVSALLSLAVLLANYKIPVTARHPLLIGGLLAVSGWSVWFHILLACVSLLPIKEQQLDPSKNARPSPLAVFFCFLCAIAFVDLLHLYLCCYPGVLTTDSIWQMEQALNIVPYSNHHPFWHTILIQGIIKIGCALFHDINAAVALYSTILVLFFAASHSYALTTLYQCQISKGWIIFAFIICTFVPYNIAYSITMWKDVVFGCAALLFVVALFRTLKDIGKHPWLNTGILCFSAIGLGLWRSNGWIALFASTAIFAVVLYKEKKKLLALLAFILIGTYLLKGPVLDAWNVTQPDLIEALSIPEQQIALVIVKNHDLTQEQQALLSKVADPEEIRRVYTQNISDPVKAHLRSKNPSYLEENISAYFKLWVELGMQYPADYLRAWIEQTRGYWNGGYWHWIFLNGVNANDMGIFQSKRGNNLSLFVNQCWDWFNASMLTEPLKSIGLHVWLILILFVSNLLNKRKEALLAVPLLFIVATLLVATPVFSEFRYAYSIFTVYPFYLAVTVESVSCKKRES